MQSVLVIVLTLSVVIVLLHRKVEIGHAMLVGSLLLTALTFSAPLLFVNSVVATALHPNTWEILIALYFVMCLEYQLRTSGLLDDVMAAARAKLISDKLLLAGMPAFLGFLPSLGGALFSAPMVDNASRRYNMTPEQKTAVNYWFRHIWEYVNPINPGLLLAGQITGILLPTLIGSMSGFVIGAIVIGWLVCLAGVQESATPPSREIIDETGCEFVAPRRSLNPVLFTAGPILLNIFLVVALHLAASLSMTIVVVLMMIVLRQGPAEIKAMLRHGLDRKLLWGIASVLLFQRVLQDTTVLVGVVRLMEAYPISPLVVAGVLAFAGGILTGTSSGFVALAMPIIVVLSPGDVAAVSVGFILGTAGQMLSPMHMCFLVSIRYFGADFARSMKPIAIMEAMMVGMVLLRYGFF
jgi:integral membrane protein (TIGR00529 family)